MPNCTKCGESMWIVCGENSTAAAYACVSTACSPSTPAATLNDVLAELRAIRSLLERQEAIGVPTYQVSAP